jgi:hypothetical protein
MKLKLRNRPSGRATKASEPRKWVGSGKDAIPPRKGRKPRTEKWEVTDEVLERIATLATRGLSKEQICYALDISPDTLERRSKENVETGAAVADAIKRGRAKGIAVIVNKSFEFAQDPKNVADRLFWLKNQAGWRDAQSHEHSGPEGKPIETVVKKEYTDDERAIKLASLIAQAEFRRQSKRSGGNKLKITSKGNGVKYKESGS